MFSSASSVAHERIGGWTAGLCVLTLMLMFAPAPGRADTIALQNPSGGQDTVRVTSLKEARYRGTVRQQYDFSCGSAAIATLLTYQYGYPMNEQTAFQQMFADGNQAKIRREGFSLLDMKRFLDERGFDADGFEAPLDKLEQAQLPAIALITENGYHHFVVIKGMRDGRLLIGDPALGTHALSRASFEARWDNNVLFVIHNHKGDARFNNPADWRYAPEGPRWLAIQRDGLQNVTVPKFGPNDF